METVGIGWRPLEGSAVQPRQESTNRDDETIFASPSEYARMQRTLAAEGADPDWIQWALGNEEEGEA